MRLWRNNTGVGYSMDASRVISFGLKGSADISGIMKGGRRIEIEVKGPRGRQRKEQKAYQRMIESLGGLYILAYSEEDVAEALTAEGF